MKIDYVCMGSTENPDFLDYWPIVSKVWYKKFNIIPVLGLISNEDGDFEKTEYGIIKNVFYKISFLFLFVQYYFYLNF